MHKIIEIIRRPWFWLSGIFLIGGLVCNSLSSIYVSKQGSLPVVNDFFFNLIPYYNCAVVYDVPGASFLAFLFSSGKWKILFLCLTILIMASLIIGRGHYSIDVFAAVFFAYAISKFGEKHILRFINT